MITPAISLGIGRNVPNGASETPSPSKETSNGFRAVFHPLLSRGESEGPARVEGTSKQATFKHFASSVAPRTTTVKTKGTPQLDSETESAKPEEAAGATAADLIATLFAPIQAKGPAAITMNFNNLTSQQDGLNPLNPQATTTTAAAEMATVPEAAPEQAATTAGPEQVAFSARLVDLTAPAAPKATQQPMEAPRAAAQGPEKPAVQAAQQEAAPAPVASTGADHTEAGTHDKNKEGTKQEAQVLAHTPASAASYRQVTADSNLQTAEVAAPRASEVFLEETRPASIISPNSVSVRLTQSNNESILLKINGSPNDLQVSVQSSNTVLNETLRGGLQELAGHMQSQGIQADFWKPAVAEAAAAQHSANEENPTKDGGSQNHNANRPDQQRQGGGRQQDQSQRWANTYDPMSLEF